MWVLCALGSAFFAGITSILAKCGIKKTDSNVATAIRTIVVLLMAALMTLIGGSFPSILTITLKTWIFLILSGLCTGASWLFYFKALQLGEINKVVPIDKSSVILSLLLAFIVLGEPISLLKGGGVILIGCGTFLMIEKKKEDETKIIKKRWFIYAILSCIFASFTSILGKIGMQGVESNLGTFLETIVVLVMAWIMVFVTKKSKEVLTISKKELLFICLSGIATGASWLLYYKALKDGLASVVVPVDKLSILVTISFSYIVFKEKLSIKGIIGLFLIVGGTLMMIF